MRALCVAAALLLIPLPLALAGGSAERVLVLVDPQRADALHVANHYVAVRGVPSRNVLYFDPAATDFEQFLTENRIALDAWLRAVGIADHIDYVVVAPCRTFFIAAPNRVNDACATVRRFSLSGAYTITPFAPDVQSWSAGTSNGYYTSGLTARAFDAQTAWYNGEPSAFPGSLRFCIGAMLGYTGPHGNTVEELLAMIDRSAAVDGTFPSGTFYFMKTNDTARSRPRDYLYSKAVQRVRALGSDAERREGPVLPKGRDDCLGIMTGSAVPGIDGADLTIRPGAFCDHMTSFAARFDSASHEKVSRWIARGASGSWGAVEEPCNYAGKFPTAYFHVYYRKGASLGEAALRSARYIPFQMLLYGDPLTRPFARIPQVAALDLSAAPLSGQVMIRPEASSSEGISGFELLLDGVRWKSLAPGENTVLDTHTLADGWHELRVIAYDDTLVRSAGRVIEPFEVSNSGRSVQLDISTTSGELSTAFQFDANGAGGGVLRYRLLHNERVVATAASDGKMSVHGATFGAGAVTVHAEALFADGMRVRSAPHNLVIAPTRGAASDVAPIAFDDALQFGGETIVYLPATSPAPIESLTWELLKQPAQSEVIAHRGPVVVLRAAEDAAGTDNLVFRVRDGAGRSADGTITLRYPSGTVGDMNCDGFVSISDISPFVIAMVDPEAYQSQFPECNLVNGDLNDDGFVSVADINGFVHELIVAATSR